MKSNNQTGPMQFKDRANEWVRKSSPLDFVIPGDGDFCFFFKHKNKNASNNALLGGANILTKIA